MSKLRHTLLGLAGAAAALLGAQARADGPTFSGNVALATDYTFRGVSQTLENPAVQGGFDYANGAIYAGVWASNIDFGLQEGSLEIDLYGGYKPTVGPVTLDLGFVYYTYPNASPEPAELDYLEFKLGATYPVTDAFTLGGALFYSPEFTGETGDGLYVEANAAYTVNDTLAFSGALGNQSTDTLDWSGAPGLQEDYTTWNLGATVSAYGFGFDLRYVDTDIDRNVLGEGRAVFTIKRAL